MTILSRLTAIAAMALLALPAPAAAKAARCAIRSTSGKYLGPCDFTSEGKGSFTVAPVRGGSLGHEVTILSVQVVEPGTAEVRGLTRAGINSRWGAARRSKKDSACWVGDDFSICVY